MWIAFNENNYIKSLDNMLMNFYGVYFTPWCINAFICKAFFTNNLWTRSLKVGLLIASYSIIHRSDACLDSIPLWPLYITSCLRAAASSPLIGIESGFGKSFSTTLRYKRVLATWYLYQIKPGKIIKAFCTLLSYLSASSFYFCI